MCLREQSIIWRGNDIYMNNGPFDDHFIEEFEKWYDKYEEADWKFRHED